MRSGLRPLGKRTKEKERGGILREKEREWKEAACGRILKLSFGKKKV